MKRNQFFFSKKTFYLELFKMFHLIFTNNFSDDIHMNSNVITQCSPNLFYILYGRQGCKWFCNEKPKSLGEIFYLLLNFSPKCLKWLFLEVSSNGWPNNKLSKQFSSIILLITPCYPEIKWMWHVPNIIGHTVFFITISNEIL